MKKNVRAKGMRLAALVLAAAIVLSLAGCGWQKPADSAEPAGSAAQTIQPAPAETWMFTDDAGREVEVPGEITRIVPSAPLAQIILYAIAPDLFVGLAAEWYDSARGIVDDGQFDLPCFGSLYASADLNVEELALTDPQLIIDIGDEKGSAAEDMDALQRQTGIPSVFISATLETMPQTYRTLGKLLGREDRGEELAQFCERIYTRTTSIMDEVGENKVKALYVLGQEGLNVLAKGSYHAELLDLLTDNAAVVDSPISKGTGNAVTMEQIALWDPEFVIFAPDSIYDTVEETATWNQVTAIVNGAYVRVPDAPHNWMSMPPSVQRYLGLIWLTAQLYPEHCDYDVKEDILEYYRLFYGCELTEEQYAAITEGAFCQ